MTNTVIPMSTRSPSPAIVAAVNAVLAEGWIPPSGEILTDEELPAAEREIRRLWQEFDRIYDEFAESATPEDDHERMRVRERAVELTRLALQAPISTRPGALAVLRILKEEALKLFECADLCAPAIDHVLNVLEGSHGMAQATREERPS